MLLKGFPKSNKSFVYMLSNSPMNSPTNKPPNSNPFKKFVQCLDNYQHRKNMTVQDTMELFHVTQQQYNLHLSEYYTNTATKGSSGTTTVRIPDNTYVVWQSLHEIDPLQNLESPKPLPSKYQMIDDSFETIEDILRVLEKHTYDEDIEYNIDLQALHKIKPELEAFNSMIGNAAFKKSILRQLLYFIQGFADSNKEYKHMVITGPPGTGKTEMAKIIGKMYSKIGILKNNVFKKVTRSDLVAGYLGQTAIKTRKIIDECIGGVMFFDEAYSMTVDESYSKECIDTICECLSNHKNDFMMIIAGYEEELDQTFFRINSGMNSRFIWRFHIDGYGVEELTQIFQKFVRDASWQLAGEVDVKWFSEKKDHFKYNGRDMELLFSYVKVAHAQRIYGKDASLKTMITIEDMNKGYAIFEENKKLKKKENLFGLYI